MSQITSPIILDTTGQDIVDAIESLSNRANDIENFTSSDVADGSATAWTSVTPLASGEVHSSIFAKISQMFKNIRYLYKMLGTTNISSIGGGTVTGAISELNSNLQAKTWTPHLYDYTTKKAELGSQIYFKFGELYVMMLSLNNCDYTGISTMIQFRNLPCTSCISGTIYFQGLKTASLAAGKGIAIQGSGTYAYPRANVISSDFADAASSGGTMAVFFGI